MDDPYHHANNVHPNTLSNSYRYDQNQHSISGMSHADNDHMSAPIKTNRAFHDHQRVAPRPTKSSSSDASGAGKAKLPHGLTVHELKEMTKARLQAEASEIQEFGGGSHDSMVPTIVGSDFRETHVPSPTMPSPPHFGRNTRSPFPDHNFPPESWSHDSRNDGWENGSVSTQTSDYIGSEHAYDNGFHRAGSFSTGSAMSAPPRDISSPAMGQSQSPSFYDGGFVPNRRRAATLSPRLGLSHLHEDRPYVPGQELPGLPSFNPTRQAPLSFASRPDRFHQAGVIGSNADGNRARTSSAVSLPAMSHTADEFSDPRLSPFTILREGEAPAAVTGLSDVFRESPNRFLGNDLHSMSFGEPQRGRASTWSATATQSSDLFGPGLLADDLASILKLSGAEEK